MQKLELDLNDQIQILTVDGNSVIVKFEKWHTALRINKDEFTKKVVADINSVTNSYNRRLLLQFLS
jgi:hypothetical protein